jgi:hypothetical protein
LQPPWITKQSLRSKQRLVGNFEFESALAEPGEFFPYGDVGNLALHVRAKRSEHDFLVEAPDQLLWSEKAMKLVEGRNASPSQRTNSECVLLPMGVFDGNSIA